MNRPGRALVAAVLALSLLGCSDDDDDVAPPADSAPVSTTTTAVAESGGIDVPEIEGTFAAAVPALGFGIAIPEGWEATLLAEEALARLEEADLARPSFLEAARAVASTGAVFYAAGIDTGGRVAELKIDVQDDAATEPAAVRAAAEAVVASGAVEQATIVDDLPDGRVRVDYRTEVPSADGDEMIDARGGQLFVPDGDRLWSLIITSEDGDVQDRLLEVFQESFTLS